MITQPLNRMVRIIYICTEPSIAFMKRRANRKQQFELDLAISELNKSFSLITDLSQLQSNFVSRIKEITNTSSVYVFLLDPDYNRFSPVGEEGESVPADREIYFKPGDKLIFWLNVNKTLLNIPEDREVFSFFTEREKGVLQKLAADIIYPFVLMNQVKGLVVLGEKESGHYSPHELQMLTMLFEQASFAFENAMLYKQQRERSGKMYRADRLATLGELAAGAAHEIRNPLTTIRSTIQYLGNRIDDPDDKSLADGLISEVDRINDIIQDMLSFSKPEELKIEESDLHSLINQTIRLVENSAKSQGIAIELDYQSRFKTIKVDENLIKQALINILMNAIQAIQIPDGLIQIEVRDIASEDPFSKGSAVIMLEIRDNGSGVPGNRLEKVFDPFYTTKREGTGLGLSITYSIIHRHGGEIEFESEVGKGTVVKIKLPGKVN